ncbi:hypothetical protein GLYMA_05G079050v4 [Glycine max]|nr:hypothetical protein GLYMA_05G079050v4 [Glycine max]KAH1133310.1 hypothetical protein GYH30_011937 [Glycine max]
MNLVALLESVPFVCTSLVVLSVAETPCSSKRISQRLPWPIPFPPPCSLSPVFL